MSEAGDVPAGARSAWCARRARADRSTGAWRCRTIKLGGMTRAVVYSWFHCRIRAYAGGLIFEKINGSQRMAGQLYPEGDGYVYLGASWVKGEPPHRYSGNGASVGARATPDDQIGRLHRHLSWRAPRTALSRAGIHLRRDRAPPLIWRNEYRSPFSRNIRHPFHHGVRAPARLRAFRRPLAGRETPHRHGGCGFPLSDRARRKRRSRLRHPAFDLAQTPESLSQAHRGPRCWEGATAESSWLRFTIGCSHETDAQRFWLEVVEHNHRARHVYRSMGWNEEGIVRDAYFDDARGRRGSFVQMSILKTDGRTARARRSCSTRRRSRRAISIAPSRSMRRSASG